jgi:alanine racemase
MRAAYLSSADDAGPSLRKPKSKFRKAIEEGRTMGLDLLLNNLANSAGLMKFKDAHFDMVRPGIMLYGGLPSPDFNPPMPLKPVMRFSGQVIQVRDFPDHTPVSCGRTYLHPGSQKDCRSFMGYGEGLPEICPTGGRC